MVDTASEAPPEAGPEAYIDELLPRYHDDGHRIAPRPAWTESAEQLLERRETRNRQSRRPS